MKTKKTFLITGVGGFVGYNLARHYSKYYNVVGIYRKQKPKIKNITLIKTDLSKKKLSTLLQKNHLNIDVIIHCSSKTPVSKYKTKNIYSNNILQMKNILNIRQNFRKFIFLSTMSVYGEINTKYVKESYRGKNINPYGLSKLKCEEMLKEFTKKNKISSYVFRLPGVVGKFSHSNFMSTVIKKIKENKNLKLSNPSSKFNNIVHVNLLIKYIDYAIHKKNHFGIFNIASTVPLKLSKIIGILSKYFKYKKKIKWKKNKNKTFCINLVKANNFGFKLKSTRKNINEFVQKN